MVVPVFMACGPGGDEGGDRGKKGGVVGGSKPENGATLHVKSREGSVGLRPHPVKWWNILPLRG